MKNTRMPSVTSLLRFSKRYKSYARADDTTYYIYSSLRSAALKLGGISGLTADGAGAPLILTAAKAFIDGALPQCGYSLSEREIGLVPDAARLIAAARSMDESELNRLLRRIDISSTEETLEKLSQTHHLLSEKEPVYRASTGATRSYMRVVIQRAAENEGKTVAELISRGAFSLRAFVNDRNTSHERAYRLVNLALPHALSAAIIILSGSAAAGALSLLPLSELVKRVADRAVTHLLPEPAMPELDFKNGIPRSCRTLCAVPVMLSSPEDAAAAAEKLERCRLLNRRAGDGLSFCLLVDLCPAERALTENDEIIIDAAAKAVDELTRRYGGGFCLFTRPRTLSGSSGEYCGHERKRGAIGELCGYLRGMPSALTCRAGDGAALVGAKYVIILDADTETAPEALTRLAMCAAHPMNTPTVTAGVVTDGYGAIRPQISVDVDSAQTTAFSRLFSGGGGIDFYGGASGDVYQALTGTTVFTGKGILDIDCYLECLSHRFPENRVLSHDLLEGEFLRCGFAGTIELTEDFPNTLKAYRSRLDRWTRGDWQNAPWLFKSGFDGSGRKVRNALSPVSKWRILDNLRRSLVPVGGLAALLTAIAARRPVFSVPALIYLAALIAGGAPLKRLALLPVDAVTSVGAASTALWRMFVSRKNLLLWNAFAPSPRVITKPKRFTPSAPDSAFVYSRARELWRYFDELAVSERGFIPPDNVFRGTADERTSPTNIGMTILAAMSAYDLGFIGNRRLLPMLSGIAETLTGLQRYEGHYFNWYSLTDFEPIPPFVISTADSGNLAASLCTVIALLERRRESGLAEIYRGILAGLRFETLYDARCDLLYITKDASTGEGSEGHYDLFCSEALLASYIASARGDVPPEHWLAPARPPAPKAAGGTLAWYGSAFEYMLPRLFLPAHDGSLKTSADRAAADAQRRDRRWGLWGRSESAYADGDALGYRPNGVGSLALSRDIGDGCNISPYSSFLTLPQIPRAAVSNLRRLYAAGACGHYGYYDSVIVDGGVSPTPVFMAHHQGMCLAAADNYLRNNVHVRRFMSFDANSAYDVLLRERRR